MAALAAVLFAASGCAIDPVAPVAGPAPAPAGSAAPGALCANSGVTLHADFEGAPPMRCAIDPDGGFTLLIGPEHAPPINPSPWYAFRYDNRSSAAAKVTLRYLSGRHRYPPKRIEADGRAVAIEAEVPKDRSSASFRLPPGSGTIAAEELVGEGDNRALLERLSAFPGVRRFMVARSHDGRAIEAVHWGDDRAPRLLVLLGRQHPPEVSGALAMARFVERLVGRLSSDPGRFSDTQMLIVPMLNPDGVVRGHWRANLGGLDLNRDWGEFTQPESRGVKAWLDARPAGVRPVLMVDFHSTNRNLFYVQGEEEAQCDTRFPVRWLGPLEGRIADYPFTIERRNANPGRGTAKNWFCKTYRIPALTYEVADEADRDALLRVAEQLADRLMPALDTGGETP